MVWLSLLPSTSRFATLFRKDVYYLQGQDYLSVGPYAFRRYVKARMTFTSHGADSFAKLDL